MALQVGLSLERFPTYPTYIYHVAHYSFLSKTFKTNGRCTIPFPVLANVYRGERGTVGNYFNFCHLYQNRKCKKIHLYL